MRACSPVLCCLSLLCAATQSATYKHLARVCYGTECSPLDGAVEAIGGWRAALPTVPLKGDVRRNCVSCDLESMSRAPDHPHEVWVVAGGVESIERLPRMNALWFVANHSHKQGWVPPLIPTQLVNTSTGWRKYPAKHRLPVDLPCSSARGEDAAVLRTFFTHRTTGRPLRGGTFLEIGGANGLEQSNSWIFEACLGWKGVLVEAHPRFFTQLTRHRPASLNLQFAACKTGGWANFSAQRWTGARVITDQDATTTKGTAVQTVSVQCGELGRHLEQLGVHQLDFLSVDVEGAELTVLQSLNFASMSVGVVLVEVRGDGVRGGVLMHLLRNKLRYVGQFTGRGTAINAIIDDVYVNLTHMARFFPESNALASLRL